MKDSADSLINPQGRYQQKKLYQVLLNHFNESGLKILCFNLDINYEDLPAVGRADKALCLVKYCFRHNQIQSLAVAIEKQIESGGNKPISQASRQESSSDLLHKAIQLIKIRSYNQAINLLENALQIDPTVPEIHYYLAIALLHGSRPKLVSMSTIHKAEEHLRVTIDLQKDYGKAYILWAIIKYDYYILNGMLDRPPTYQELLEKDWSWNQIDTKEILTHITAEGNQVWDWLCNH